jgi:hypothetical protein
MLLDAIYQSNQIAKDQTSNRSCERLRGVTIVRSRLPGVNTGQPNFGFFLLAVTSFPKWLVEGARMIQISSRDASPFLKISESFPQWR